MSIKLHKLKIFILVASLLIIVAGVFSTRWYFNKLKNHKEFEIFVGVDKLLWGCFEFKSDLPNEPQVNVTYIAPSDYKSKHINGVVFYAPLANAIKPLEREEIYSIALENKLMVFTIDFNYNIQKNLPAEETYWEYESLWLEKVFEIQKELENNLGISHNKLLILGDSAGCRMAGHMAERFPDKVEAVAWCSGNRFTPYSSSKHPPTLALSTWGGIGEIETMSMVMADYERGGYSIFATVPPNWFDKADESYHHLSNKVGYDLARAFLSSIANLRAQNGGKLPLPELWSEQINTIDCGAMPSPGSLFTDAWNRYPERELRTLRDMEDTESWDILEFSLPEEPNHQAVIFLMPPELRKQVWFTDNLYFLAENGYMGITQVVTNKYDNYENEVFVLFKQVLNNPKYKNKLFQVITLGELSDSVTSVLDRLSEKELERIRRITFLNPPSVSSNIINKYYQVNVISNNPKFKGFERTTYINASGETFNSSYYNVLMQAIK